VAHAHHLGDGLHGQPVGVGGTDRLVALLPQCIASLVKGLLTLGVVLGEGREAGSGLGGLAFRSGDSRIV
jgi:hypothetical protein